MGKFNIEVQSVDRCDLNNLYQKTPRGQGARSPHKRPYMAEEDGFELSVVLIDVRNFGE